MKLRNKLLFGVIGLTSIAILPIITTSCSGAHKDETNSFLDKNNPLPGVSSDSNNKLNNLWTTDVANSAINISKLGTSLVDKLNSANLVAKNKQQVQEIADNNFNQLNNETLKEIMFNAFNASSMHGEVSDVVMGVNQTAYNKFMYDVQKVDFNKAKSEVGFEFVMSVFQHLNVKNGNASQSCGIAKSIIFKFSNLKIESFVREISWKNQTKLLPSIRISTNQPNARLELVDYKILGDENNLRQVAEFVYDAMPSQPDQPKPPKEEFVNQILNGENGFRYYNQEAEALKKIGNKFGIVDGAFKVEENLPDFSISTEHWDYRQIVPLTSVFNALGFENAPSSNNGELVPSALKTHSMFAYSTVKQNNDVEWEAYNLA